MFTKKEAEEVINGLALLWEEGQYEDTRSISSVLRKLEKKFPCILDETCSSYMLESEDDESLISGSPGNPA